MSKNNTKIAVFIDGDNVSYKHSDVIFEEIKTYGEVLICRVYSDWSQPENKGWLAASNENGSESIQCSRISGKSSTDIKLTVDMMHCLFKIPMISTYVLVASDSDYRHLIPEVKKLGKTLYCIGRRQSNKSLKMSCDIFIELETLVNDFKSLDKTTLNKFRKCILDTLASKPIINMSAIYEILQRKYKFDYRDYGFEAVTPFIMKYFKDIVKVIRTKDGLFIESK